MEHAPPLGPLTWAEGQSVLSEAGAVGGTAHVVLQSLQRGRGRVAHETIRIL